METEYAPNTPEYRAVEVAKRNGKAAASWAFDGSTRRETYAEAVRKIEAGDPEIYDRLRTPDLSGEYAGEFTEADLMEEVGWVPRDGTDLRDELARLYLDEVSSAFWAEVERLAREGLAAYEANEAADAYEELSETVTEAVMKAERSGLRPQDVISCILGDLSVRPGYPADDFAPLIRD